MLNAANTVFIVASPVIFSEGRRLRPAGSPSSPLPPVPCGLRVSSPQGFRADHSPAVRHSDYSSTTNWLYGIWGGRILPADGSAFLQGTRTVAWASTNFHSSPG